MRVFNRLVSSCGLALTLATVASTGSSARQLTATATSFSVKCWWVGSGDSSANILATEMDTGCPVSVDIPMISANFQPGDNVPVLWNVALKSESETTNAIGMKMPPPATLAAGADPTTTQATQISVTYVRSCNTIETCDPTSKAATQTEAFSGNFSTNGDSTPFRSLEGLKFDAAGEYPIAAFVAVRSHEDTALAYVYAAYTTIKVTEVAAPSNATHEQGKVRCRMSRQSALNATLDPESSAMEGDKCEVAIQLAPIQVVRPETAQDISFVATLDQSDGADFHITTPLPTMQVNGASYEIVSSSLKICKADTDCDEYTESGGLVSVTSAGPQSFKSNQASFTAKKVIVPTAGTHPALVHLVLAGNNRRYDFMYYFTLLATATDLASAVDTANYTADGNTSYCWSVLADGTQDAVTSSSVAVSAQGGDCPYVAGLSIKSATVTEEDTLDLSWTVSASESFSANRSTFGAVNLTTVYDATTKADVSLPGLHLYACSEGTVCTPFSTNKTLLVTASARNLVDGKAVINAESIKFPSKGTYTIMAHSVLPNGASRVDTAVYAVVTVTSGNGAVATEKSHTVMYILVSVGSVLGVVIIFFVVVGIRKRRHRQRMEKMVQFGLFGAPAGRQPTLHKSTESRSSVPSEQRTAPPGSFDYMQAERSPADLFNNNRGMPVLGGGGVQERKDSLSYDPYQRTSFMEMSLNESNLSFALSDGDRPSTGSEAYEV